MGSDAERALTRMLRGFATKRRTVPVQRATDGLVEGLRERYRGVQDLGVKRGPFHVLFLSSMPAVLVESGFLTHRDESRRLRTRAYSELVAQRIAEGLARWRDASGPVLAGSGR